MAALWSVAPAPALSDAPKPPWRRGFQAIVTSVHVGGETALVVREVLVLDGMHDGPVLADGAALVPGQQAEPDCLE
jgi:hypothetical protein